MILNIAIISSEGKRKSVTGYISACIMDRGDLSELGNS